MQGFPIIHNESERMGGRAVEGTGLENRQACERLVGSNPTPSAIFQSFPLTDYFFMDTHGTVKNNKRHKMRVTDESLCLLLIVELYPISF